MRNTDHSVVFSFGLVWERLGSSLINFQQLPLVIPVSFYLLISINISVGSFTQGTRNIVTFLILIINISYSIILYCIVSYHLVSERQQMEQQVEFLKRSYEGFVETHNEIQEMR
jgi:hypothetical protein